MREPDEIMRTIMRDLRRWRDKRYYAPSLITINTGELQAVSDAEYARLTRIYLDNAQLMQRSPLGRPLDLQPTYIRVAHGYTGTMFGCQVRASDDQPEGSVTLT